MTFVSFILTGPAGHATNEGIEKFYRDNFENYDYLLVNDFIQGPVSEFKAYRMNAMEVLEIAFESKKETDALLRFQQIMKFCEIEDITRTKYNLSLDVEYGERSPPSHFNYCV